MKSKHLLLMLLLALVVPWAANAQTTVTIGDGTSAYYYTPIGTYYNYSITEQLYTAEEIGSAGTISSVSFYWAYTSAKNFNITMYMANVDAENLSTGISLADADEVFSGTLLLPETAGWVTITLDTPFDYDGTSNLLIGVNKTGGDTWFSGNTWQYTSATDMARYTQQDGSAYDTSTVPGTKTNYRPNIQLSITAGSGPVCEKPETFEVSNVTANSATLTWTGGSGTYNVEYKGGSVADWTAYLTNTTATTANLTGLTPGTAYQYRVQSVCGSDVSGWKNVSFQTMFGIPLNEAFGTSIPSGWSMYTGLLDDVMADPTALAAATYGWSFGTGNGVFDSHARVNIYGTSCKYWLVTPAVLMENNVQLTFDLALTAYSGTLGAPATTGTDDKFVVLINAGGNWSVLRQWDNAGSEYVYNNIACSAAGEGVAIDLSSYAGQQIAIAFYGESLTSNADNNLHIDNVSIDYIPDCSKPTGLAVSNVTAHEATISWTSDATAWQIGYTAASGTEQYVEVTTNPYTLTGLTPETAYQVRVQTNCGGGTYSVFTNPVSFTTAVACTAPTGVTSSNLTGHGVTMTWTAEEGAYYQYQMIKTAIYDANNINWSAPTEENTLSWNNLDPETGYTFSLRKDCGSEDGYSSVVTRTFTTTVACPAPTVAMTNITTTTADVTCTNTEATEFNVQLINPNATPADTTTFANVAMPYTLTGLTQNTSYRVRVQALCGGDGESAWSNGTNFMTAEECPEGMVCIGTGTATSSNVPTTTCYNYSLSQQIYTAAEIGEAGAILSIDFYSTNGAQKARNFDIYMVSTDKSSFESTTDWIAVTAADLVYSATNYTWQTGWNSFELDVPFVYDGTSNVAIVIDDEKVTDYECSVNFRVFDAPSQAIYVRQDGSDYDPFNTTYTATGVLNLKNRIRLAIGEPPACPKPTGLAVEYTGGTEATISWTSDATAWNMRVNGTPINGTITNPYTLTGLELATTYEVEVQANCGDATSEWAGPVSFTTDLCLPENMCEITITLTDAYGDGGGNIQVVDVLTNEVLGSYTNSGESTTYTLAVCDGRELNFVFASTDSWSYENGWVITDINNEIISEHVGCTTSGSCDAPTNGVIANYTVSCTISTCRRPTNLAASEIGPRSAVLSWTENGEATEWIVAYTTDGENFIEYNATTSNPFTMTGLDPETVYGVKVRPICSDFDDKWSESLTFTTGVACGAPSALDVTPYPISAIVDWASFEEGYDIEWTEVSAAKDGGLWLQYDNGTYYTSIGSSTSGVRTWGVMYPAAMLEGNKNLTKVAVYENATYYTCESYTINIYQGIDQPVTLIGTETVVPSGESGMHEITLTAPITLDLTQNLWITMTVEGTYVMSACQSTERNNQWWDNNADGVWTNMVDDNSNLAGYGWMIRGYVEGYNPADFNWTSETNILPPYTIENLSPETTYFVKVKASCGTDWKWAQFTTPSACDAPVNLEATDLTYNSATLNWIGYQESYNLKYRHVVAADPSVPATIILEAHDTWGDGTGYQMLLDADATAYGVEIPESGPYTGSDYSAFEYLIPENADCDSNTENLVLDGSITLEIPAGVYDWCIINPEPGGNMWIPGNGDIPSRYDDYVFEAGVTYHFTMQMFGTGDGAALEIIRPMSDWTVVENVTTPYTFTNLTPETGYEWQVQGVNTSCTGGLTDWSEIASFTTLEQTTFTQTIALTTGWNWFSTNVEITLADLQAALATAGSGTIIKAKNNQSTTLTGTTWRGSLKSMDVAQMYKIKVSGDCEIQLEGMPINPADHPITIGNGVNWIGFPFSEQMTPTNAFAGFAANGDIIKNKDNQSATYTGSWRGNLKQLVPGQGYIYKSAATEDRTLVFPTPSKAAPKSVKPMTVGNAAVQKTVPTLDIDIDRK